MDEGFTLEEIAEAIRLPSWERKTKRRILKELATLVQAELTLQSLTPGGSEYYRDPERCLHYINYNLNSQREQIISLAKENRELRKCK